MNLPLDDESIQIIMPRPRHFDSTVSTLDGWQHDVCCFKLRVQLASNPGWQRRFESGELMFAQ
jgi:hypothetical protein